MLEMIARYRAALGGFAVSLVAIATPILAWGTAIRADMARGDWALVLLDLLAFPVGIVRGVGFWLGQ